MTTDELQHADEFFRTARDRYRIRLRKEAGEKPPWSEDQHLNRWRFCNVHREHDVTTLWFAKHIRQPLSDEHLANDSKPSLLKSIVDSTIAFRWFNKIETVKHMEDMMRFPERWDSQLAYRRISHLSPVVSGAYIIVGKPGMDKGEGVLWCIDRAREMLTEEMIAGWQTLEQAHRELQQVPYMGRFMAYEVVSDLRWTPVLDSASDICEWASAGPGCARGLGWVLNGNSRSFNYGSKRDQELMLRMMRVLLDLSKRDEYWPREWRQWEMREVEHWACEFDKYQRASVKQERLKRRYP